MILGQAAQARGAAAALAVSARKARREKSGIFGFVLLGRLHFWAENVERTALRISAELGLRWFTSQDVGSTALIFDFRRIRIALERVFDGKASKGEIAFDLFSAE